MNQVWSATNARRLSLGPFSIVVVLSSREVFDVAGKNK